MLAPAASMHGPTTTPHHTPPPVLAVHDMTSVTLASASAQSRPPCRGIAPPLLLQPRGPPRAASSSPPCSPDALQSEDGVSGAPGIAFLTDVVIELAEGLFAQDQDLMECSLAVFFQLCKRHCNELTAVNHEALYTVLNTLQARRSPRTLNPSLETLGGGGHGLAPLPLLRPLGRRDPRLGYKAGRRIAPARFSQNPGLAS